VPQSRLLPVVLRAQRCDYLSASANTFMRVVMQRALACSKKNQFSTTSNVGLTGLRGFSRRSG